MLRVLIVFYLAFTLGVGGLKWVLQSGSAARVAKLEAQQQATRKATHDANALLVLTQEYMLRGTERAASQWQAAHRALAQAVGRAIPAGASDEDLDELKDTTAHLPELFESLGSQLPGLAPGLAAERRAMLVDQILSETRLVSDLAYRRDGTLFGQVQAEAASLRERDGALNWLWLASSAFLAWMLLVRVLRPVAQLQAAAQSVQAGNLQSRCDYRSSDELGQAAASFNAMTDTLARAKERLTLALDSAGMGVWDYDLQAGTLVWDDRMFALYGRDRTGAAEPYAVWSSSLHPDDRAASEEALQHAINGVRPFDTQFRILLPDGSVRHLKAAANVVRDEAGTALRMVGVNTDITGRVATAAALQEQTALLQRVGRLASVGGWRLDLNAGAPYWDEQTRRIHEVPADFVPDLATAINFYAPEHRDLIADAVQHAMETGEGWDLELRLVTFTGRSIWVRALGELERVDGHAAFLVGAFQDITARRQAAQALQDAKAAAESASAAKSAFLANMSHEIRTPLNAVLGVAHLLEGSGLNADQQQLVAKAQMAGRSLLGIVNDVLDLAKIEAGEMALDEVLFQPAELLNELMAVHGAKAQAKGLALAVRAAPEVPRWLLGDSLRLRQILNNLIGNALKFTEQGSVQVDLGVLELGAQRARLRVAVRDTGIGIAPEVQAGLFQPFIQADVSTTRRFGGTGLGLSIVRRLAEVMDGEAGVHSAPGQGSEFWVELPMAVPSAEQQRDASSSTLEVMVVDDNPDDRLALAGMARSLGWRASLLDSGADLVNELKRRAQAGDPPPDALVVDWEMPGMDGLSALRALVGAGGRDLPLAALVVSAHERESIAAQDHERLADKILTKPVGVSEFFNAVNSGIAQRSGSTDKVMQSTRLQATLGQWLQGVRLLVVDDSDINLDVAQRLLERQGAQVQTCSSGRQALQRLRDDGADIDVVLMDVQMPDMDGLEATRQVRGTLGLRELPIVALTAGALTEERKRALAAGMNEFLSKPLDPEGLVRTIRRLVEARRGQALPLMPAVLDPAAQASAASQTAWTPVAGIDMAQAMSRLRGDWPLFISILQRLLEENGDLMLPPSGEGDVTWREALAARVHKLRGSAGTVGAVELMQLAALAEDALRAPGAPALPALQGVAQALQALHTAAAPTLAAQAVSKAALLADEHAEPLSPAQRQELIELLGRNDLEALTRVEQWAPALRATLGAHVARELEKAAQELNFTEAVNLLAENA